MPDNDGPRLLQTLAWFAWPAWPIAAWAIWRERRALAAWRWLLPALSLVCALLPVLNADDGDPDQLLAVLPPLILLASAGVPTLRRGAANAFDWFAVMTCAVFALLIWMAWSAMALDWPPGLARHMDKVAPDFSPLPDPLQLVLAGSICVIWAWRAWRTPRSPLRGALNWAQGITLLWCLAVVLLMPWFDHNKSNRPLAAALSAELAHWPGQCVAGAGLGVSQHAALYYFADLRIGTTPQDRAGCTLLLVRGERRASPPRPPADWREVWVHRRGGGRQLEVFRLYHHEP